MIRLSKMKFAVAAVCILSMVFCAFQINVAKADDGTTEYPGAPGARAVFGGINNEELFLGGNYIELGISRWGDFGTEGNKPASFRGTNARVDVVGYNKIGMSVDYDGYGTGHDLPIDFYLPSIPEERFVVGYKSGSTVAAATNSALMGHKQMPTTITNESNISKGLLKVKIVSTWTNKMEITQVISFRVNDKFYRNKVTLTNLTDQNMSSARYMRSLDPDNTAALTNQFITDNTVTHTIAEDGKAVVKAQTILSSDPIYRTFGTRAPLLFYSNDPSAKASAFGFSNTNPYDPLAYDSPRAKGNTYRYDAGITLTWESGGLAPGESKSFIYFTSLDDRDFEDIEGDIEEVKHVVTYSVIPVNGSENGSLAASVDDAVINSNDQVEEGKSVVFTATPMEGYQVKEWRESGTVVTVDGEPFTDNVFIIPEILTPEDITVEFKPIDTIPPVTVDDAPTGWQNGDVTVTLNASDDISGVAATYYQVNDGEQQTGTSVVLTEEGTHTVTYWSVDVAGNEETAKSVTVQIDKTAPVTEADAPAGWQNGNVTVTLNAGDDASGVASTYYQVNGGTEQTGTSVVLIEEGTHTVTYWSVDAAGNEETAKSVTVQIDKSAPVTEADAPAGWQNGNVTVTLNAGDDASGVASTYYQVNGGTEQTGTSVVLTEEGTHTVTFWSVDAIGNEETSKSVMVQIDKTAPVTEADTPAGWQNGNVTVTLNAGDAGSGIAATYYQVNGEAQETGTSVVLTEEGTHTVTYWSVDAAGNEESAKSVTVQIDKTAPIVNAIPNTTTLWAPNNKLVDIRINFDVESEASGIDSIILISITSNEDHSEDDIQGAEYGTEDTSFKLRATRAGNGSGRVYTITYSVTDLAGNTTVQSVTIEVPHDQGSKKDK